jgi:hypothetical protein
LAAVGLWLVAVGSADLSIGLAGPPQTRGRALLAWMVGVGCSGGGALLLNLPVFSLLGIVMATSITLAIWLLVRYREAWSRRHAALALLSFFTPLFGLIAASGSWAKTDGGVLTTWVQGLPYRVLSQQGATRFILTLGALLVMFSTGNALVRLTLASVGSDVAMGESRLKGGRIIGPMERGLIFAFAIAGQATPAALVISAKSLLRFPEITRSQEFPSQDGQGISEDLSPVSPGIHELTEYFLVGSLSSWILPLAASVLLLR